MNVINFLQNEISNNNMNADTLLTVEFRKKKYLATMQDCIDLFGGLLVKKCEKRKEINGNEMKNSFTLSVI